MDHTDHVNLLRGGIEAPGGVWADFGAGTGSFTLALADLLGPSGEIIVIDRDAGRLRTNERTMRSRFPETSASYVPADFSQAVDLPSLDGIVIANALHFVRDQAEVVELLRGYLAQEGRLLIVEYNIHGSNAAVPYPVPWTSWVTLAAGVGFAHTELLATRPSRFLREIYSAGSW